MQGKSVPGFVFSLDAKIQKIVLRCLSDSLRSDEKHCTIPLRETSECPRRFAYAHSNQGLTIDGVARANSFLTAYLVVDLSQFSGDIASFSCCQLSTFYSIFYLNFRGQQFAQAMQNSHGPIIDQLRREMEARGMNPPSGNNNQNNEGS